MSKVFISGSISIELLPKCVKESINKIINANMEIIVGDANGIDTLVQKYCNQLNYNAVTVYSIYISPRYKVKKFSSKYIAVRSELKKERERQEIKDAAMTMDSDYSFVIWDGKSKGSYNNIMRAIDDNKRVKLYLSAKNQFLKARKITRIDIEYIYRENNGYLASEVVEYLINEGEEYFQQTRVFNKCLLDNKIIMKKEGVYLPMPEYEKLFIVDKYRGKKSGIRFKNEFINWLEDWIKKKKSSQAEQLSF
jgi:hypothetical protein